ncbi:MAG: response regulator transcription factor [Alphaproteobacteria bacterium]|nr:response regulator transcription factor [Alphaproteobacteria bacterium]
MKTVFLNIKDKILYQTFSDLIGVFGFQVVSDRPADFVFEDFDDRVVVNETMSFDKPVDMFYLISKISENVDVVFGDLILNQKLKQLRFFDKTVSLTYIESKILSLLMNDEKGILASDLALDVFAKNSESQMKSLATHIYNLKKKIEEITGKQKNIILKNSRYCLDL